MTRFGGYADTVCVPTTQVFARPAGMSALEAAAIPVNYFTAWQLIVVMGSLKRNETVLVHSAGGGVGIAAGTEHTEWAALLKDKTQRRGHGAGNRCRGADHWYHRPGMADEMGKRASRGHHQHERYIAPCPKAARQRGTEWQEPSQIDADMQKIGVEKGVSEKRP